MLVTASALALSLLAGSTLPLVAVFAIENRANLTKEDVGELTDYVATQIASSGRYAIVPRSDLVGALRAKKAASYGACYDEACQIEIGKEVAAGKTLSTKVARLGGSCIVTMQLYDLRRAASERAAHAKGKCSIDAVVDSVEKAVAGLTARRDALAAESSQTEPAQERPPDVEKDCRKEKRFVFESKTGSIRTFRLGANRGMFTPGPVCDIDRVTEYDLDIAARHICGEGSLKDVNRETIECKGSLYHPNCDCSGDKVVVKCAYLREEEVCN